MKSLRTYRFLALSCVFLALSFKVEPSKSEVRSDNPRATAAPAQNEISFAIQAQKDNRVESLKAFFEARRSPLSESAPVFVEMADKYALDWRFLPAVSGVESGFGKALLEGSYNPFGWGGGYIYFDSWDEGIETVGGSLYERWILKGRTTPEQIAPTYCPPNAVNWARNVRFYMEELGKEAKV